MALGVVAVLACDSDTDDNQFREDVISCEEAVAHLVDCCPAFEEKRVACKYYYHRSEGCENVTVTRVDPDLDLRDSRCIRDATCDAIRSQNLCAYGAASPDGGAGRPVCR